MILKKSAKARKHKAELVQAHRAYEDGRAPVPRLTEYQAALIKKHRKAEDSESVKDVIEKMIS